MSGPETATPTRSSGQPVEVYILAAVSFCVALGFGIVAPALPVFAESFGVSITAASAVISVFALVRFVFAAPAGWLVDHFGEAAVLAAGLTIVAASSALAGLSQTYPQLLALRGIGGMGSAMFTVSALGLLLRVTTPDKRGQAAGTFQGGFLLGGIAGPAVGGLVTGISIRLPFFVYAATLSVATVVVVTVLIPRQRHSRVAQQVAGAAEAVVESGRSALRAALGQRAYVTALAVNLATGFTAFGMRTSLVPLFVVNALGATPRVTGYGLLVSALVQGALLWPAGWVADHVGRRPALVTGTAVTAVGMVVLGFVGGVGGFYVAMAILGFGTAFLGAAPSAVVGDITGGRRSGSVVAAFQMTSDLGAITGPLAAGLIVDSSGSYELAFFVGAAVVTVAFAMAASMPETLKRTGDGAPAGPTGVARPASVVDSDPAAAG